MLKVTPCTVGRTVVRSDGRKSKFFRLDGLLLLLLPFCIIMGYTLRAPLLIFFVAFTPPLPMEPEKEINRFIL